jgi:hypothetical protein
VLVVVGLSRGTPLGWWLAGCATFGWLLSTGLFLFGRSASRLAEVSVRKERLTGRMLQPTMVPRPYAPNGAWRWVGGAALPGAFGRVNATWPLAVLDILGGELWLRVRAQSLARMFGAGELHTPPADNVIVFPVRGRVGSKGIGISVAGGSPYYFLRNNQSEMLTTIAFVGFNVEWRERRIRYF